MIKRERSGHDDGDDEGMLGERARDEGAVLLLPAPPVVCAGGAPVPGEADRELPFPFPVTGAAGASVLLLRLLLACPLTLGVGECAALVIPLVEVFSKTSKVIEEK